MFHKESAADNINKRELKAIGQRLHELIQKNDSASLDEALKIIDTYKNDSDVINAQKIHQSTPLILACELGKKNIVKKLLAAPCIAVNQTGYRGVNAMEAALIAKQYKIAALLASDVRVDINATGREGIHHAFRVLNDESHPLALISLIISRTDMDLTVTYEDKSKWHYETRTILHCLIEEFSRIKLKADIHYRQVNSYEDYKVVIALLKKVLAARTMDLDAFTVRDIKTRHEITKQTALMMAAVGGLFDVVSLLLAAGADTELRDEQGRRAIDLVKESPVAHVRDIAVIIREFKHARAAAQSSQSMFAAQQQLRQPQPQSQQMPPPSAPPAEEVFADESEAKSKLSK